MLSQDSVFASGMCRFVMMGFLDSDPMQMGRSAGAYDALRIYPSTLVEVMKDMQAAK
jgi:hypothetical protein